MKAYIIAIIGAALLSALAEIISPGKWRGYVKIITGLVVISCIITPIMSITHSGAFRGFDRSLESAAGTDDLQRRLIENELEKRINEDIENRLRVEFNTDVTAECVLVIEEGEFKGLGEINIYGGSLTDRAVSRLCEVYGLNTENIHYE